MVCNSKQHDANESAKDTMRHPAQTGWRIAAAARFGYNALLRPSDGMADVAVSKTVVARRASSTLASGTIPNAKEGLLRSPSFFIAHDASAERECPIARHRQSDVAPRLGRSECHAEFRQNLTPSESRASHSTSGFPSSALPRAARIKRYAACFWTVSSGVSSTVGSSSPLSMRLRRLKPARSTSAAYTTVSTAATM